MKRKLNFDLNSIRFRMWLYFLILVVSVLAIIWLLQYYFLNNSYEEMKIKEVNQVAMSIRDSYIKEDPNLTQNIQDMSVTNDLYVMMEYKDTLLLFTPEQESVVPVYKYRSEVPKLREGLSDDSKVGTYFWYKFSAYQEKYSTLAYAMMLEKTEEDNVRLYVFTPLYPVTSTIKILKNQLFNVTVITLVLAFVMAIFFSRRLSSPLKRMTDSAKQMGTGDYNVKFDGEPFTEMQNLASTLNMTAYELGSADARQKDMIANVSHDLKTPLTMVRSYAEMIRDLSGDNPAKRNEHLQVIMDEADRMNKLVSDMATVSKMRTNEITLEQTYFDLAKATASILASYEILEAQEGYEFTFNSPKECMVYADEDKITQVIQNLTGNAIKYCGEDKKILIDIRRIGRKYRLEVSDHGPGIKEEELPHIWDRYYKASSNYVRPASGTGLGLSIVKEILTKHNAAYGVVSKLDSGSTFWFELPMMKKPQ